MTLQEPSINYFRSLDWVLKREGFIIFIGGAKEKGKTDFSLLLAEWCLFKGYRVKIATNIKAQTSDYAIKQITNLPDLKQWLRGRGWKLYILDEAGKHIGKMRFMTKQNIEFMNVLQTIRHYKAGFIGIAPSEKFIDNNFLDNQILDAKIIKVSKTEARIYNYLYKDHYTLYNIPATSILFDDKDLAMFEMTKPQDRKKTRVCCEVARLYANGESSSDIVKNYYPMQTRMWVMRKVREHLKH